MQSIEKYLKFPFHANQIINNSTLQDQESLESWNYFTVIKTIKLNEQSQTNNRKLIHTENDALESTSEEENISTARRISRR